MFWKRRQSPACEEVLGAFIFCEVGDCGLQQWLLCGTVCDPCGGTQVMEFKLLFLCVHPASWGQLSSILEISLIHKSYFLKVGGRSHTLGPHLPRLSAGV